MLIPYESYILYYFSIFTENTIFPVSAQPMHDCVVFMDGFDPVIGEAICRRVLSNAPPPRQESHYHILWGGIITAVGLGAMHAKLYVRQST